MDVKRRCRDQRDAPGFGVLECDRPYGHKKKKHRSRWRDGVADRYVDIVVRWPRKR